MNFAILLPLFLFAAKIRTISGTSKFSGFFLFASGREFIGFAEDVTAIKSIETVKADGAIYNLASQQVKKAQKGVYIINGKKAIVK